MLIYSFAENRAVMEWEWVRSHICDLAVQTHRLTMIELEIALPISIRCIARVVNDYTCQNPRIVRRIFDGLETSACMDMKSQTALKSDKWVIHLLPQHKNIGCLHDSDCTCRELGPVQIDITRESSDRDPKIVWASTIDLYRMLFEDNTISICYHQIMSCVYDLGSGWDDTEDIAVRLMGQLRDAVTTDAMRAVDA